MRRAAAVVMAVCLMGFALVLAEPAFATAATAAQHVFVTNSAEHPVPVAPKGTTRVSGTVTVANPTPAAAAPLLIQQAFETQPITRDAPFASGTLYEVPVGKLLTVEYFQAHWSFSGVGLRQAGLRAGQTCSFGESTDPNIDRLQTFFPDQNAGDGYHVVGGPVKLLVPSGGCLTYEVGANYADIGEGTTIYMYGGFTGYLTDAPAA
jgi:hypothetical protein